MEFTFRQHLVNLTSSVLAVLGSMYSLAWVEHVTGWAPEVVVLAWLTFLLAYGIGSGVAIAKVFGD